MRPVRALVWSAVVAALAASGWLLASDPFAGERRVRDDTGPAAQPSHRPHAPPPEPATMPVADAIDALRAALPANDPLKSATAAAALRRVLRKDETARRAVEAVLLDPATPSELRMALAFVLGTLPDGPSDRLLIEALGKFAGEDAFVRCALLALGATREPPEDDEIFEMGDRPWGQHGPGGLGITVKRVIEDPRVRDALAEHFDREEVALRESTALALRHSLEQSEVRDLFLAVLSGESADDVAGELGEALASWAGSAPEAKRGAIVTRLLERVGEQELAGYRFRMEDDFKRLPLSAADRERVGGYTETQHPFGVRDFALGLLATTARRSGDEAVAAARALLTRYLKKDEQTAIRDRTAQLLGALPPDPATIGALAAAARNDAAWNVRYSAIASLGRFKSDPAAKETLKAATQDKDARVAALAKELLG